MSKGRIALAPLASPDNRFAELFAAAVTRADYDVVRYRWGFRDLLACRAIIMHWPNRFLGGPIATAPFRELARLRLARLAGVKLVWVAHNVRPHERASTQGFLEKRFIGALDGVIYLSEASREAVRATYQLPRRTVELTTVHGAYAETAPVAYTPPTPDARVRLGNFGLVRPYKNIEELVAAAATLDPAAVTLTVRGRRHDRAYAAALEESARAAPAIVMELSDDVLPEDALERWLDTLHGVVLPYRDILNSGAAIHALSRGRPVLVPARGAMPELARIIGAEWVRLYDGALTHETLQGFAAHLRAIPAGARPDLSPIAWDRVRDDLARFLDALLR